MLQKQHTNQQCFFTLTINYPKRNKTIPFIIAAKTIKYVEINLNKEVKDLYTENFKTLMKGTKKDTSK